MGHVVRRTRRAGVLLILGVLLNAFIPMPAVGMTARRDRACMIPLPGGSRTATMSRWMRLLQR